MKIYLFIFFAIATWLNASLSALPAHVIIIRHAEKNTSKGHSDKKNVNEELSLKGKERAAALPIFLLGAPELTALNSPAAIYASIPPKPAISQSAIETVRPLAEILKISVRDKFESNDYKRMVEEIKNDSLLSGKTVLICWENTYIPEIARAFGAFQTPATWSPSTYDRAWVITFQPSGKPIFQNLPQRLMYGDSST